MVYALLNTTYIRGLSRGYKTFLAGKTLFLSGTVVELLSESPCISNKSPELTFFTDFSFPTFMSSAVLSIHSANVGTFPLIVLKMSLPDYP